MATDTGQEAPVADAPLPEVPKPGDLAARPFEWGWPGDQPYQLPYDYDAKIVGDSPEDGLGWTVSLDDQLLTATRAMDRAYVVDLDTRGEVSLAEASSSALALPDEVSAFGPCGDVNADGRTDLAVQGANPENPANDGRILFWSPDGTELARAFFPTPADPAYVGDLTGDGADDVLVRGWEHAWIWHGPLPERPVWDNAATLITRTADPDATYFGGGGDADGDGADDLLLIDHADHYVRICVAAEPAPGVIDTADLWASATACVNYDGREDDTTFRSGRLEDVDADGNADLVVEIAGWRDQGGVFIFHAPLPMLAAPEEAAMQFRGIGGSAHGLFGSASAIGHLDADGVTDIAIHDPFGYARGTVAVFRSPGEGVHEATDADITFAGDEKGPVTPPGDAVSFGSPTIFDVDGDGQDDLLIGAAGDDENGVDAGAIYLFLGANLF